MDIPTLSFLNAKDDREKLIGFLWWLQKFLELMVKESQSGSGSTSLFSSKLPDDLRKAIYEAWDELNNRQGAFEKAVRSQKEVSDSNLERNGLTGAQLGLKFRMLRWICERFGTNQSPTWLRRVIKGIDDVLDSIASVNPVAHGIKEFKDVLSSLTWE